jgi:hypothetical protein
LSQLIADEREVGAILASRGDAAGAIVHAGRGLSLAQKYANGPEPGLRKRYLAESYYGLASVNRTLRQWREARENAQQAIAAWNSPEVKEVNPKHRQEAAAILADSFAHLPRK